MKQRVNHRVNHAVNQRANQRGLRRTLQGGDMMHALRDPSGFIRGLNALVLVFFLTTFYAPSALAMKVGIEEQQKQGKLQASLPENQGDNAAYTASLKRMKGHLQEAERLYNEQDKNLIGIVTDIKNAIETGGSLFQQDERWKRELAIGLQHAGQATELNASVDAGFEEVERWLQERALPEAMQQRHDVAYAQYEQHYAEFSALLTPLQRAQSEDDQINALRALNKFLVDQQFGRQHQAFDQDRLGNSSPESAKGAPLLLTANDYFRAGMDANPRVQLAALGDFDFSQLPQADDPAYLAESDEVVLSDRVRAKAAELEHDPVKIYHWVRNNIETIPGWGSYQNADLTLGAQRGNAIDVASLLIALLRASGIPARYAIGVADLDAARYNNWMGNFADANVASNYASDNGIATQLAVHGGVINTVRTQHMWVQAAIDFFPSRGAKNNSADAWVDMDASFKQYDYQAGLDAIDITGIDPEALAEQFVNSGTVDETAGFVQNLDPAQLLAAQEQAQADLQAYIENNLTDPTVGDVIGGRRTIIKEYPALPSSLPYEYVRGTTYGSIPAALQNKVAVGFDDDRVEFPFARVNNQKVTLQFTPATQADEDALAALLPDGEITDVSQLPDSIPSYLISVIPELSLNGEVFHQAPAMRLGREINLSYQLSGPLATYAPYHYSVVAGSYLNVPLVAQSVSPEILIDLQARVEETRTILEAADPVQLATLSRDAILGDLFYAGGLGYFAQYSGLSHIAALQSNGSHKLEFGYGSYGYEPNVSTFFGVVRGIKTGGAAMNIRLANTVQSNLGEQDTRVQMKFQAGLLSSALEHAVPEQMFSDPANPTDGVSAVKALQIAASNGQKIYQIDDSNLNAALNDITLDPAVEAEIRESVNNGLTVITHSDDIQVPGWSGAGYVILDTDTGAGSYKISGGGNGSYLLGLTIGITLVGILVATLATGSFVVIGSILASLGINATFFAAWNLEFSDEEFDFKCFAVGLMNGLFSIGFFFGSGVAAIGIYQALVAALGFGTLYTSRIPNPRQCLFGD
ncbi:MAG: transglutaminase domain-containing protein [Gammaproteobacteria bacterium]|nr:transglutaminase domain-containing protein [Gammaproteobacteria bacterium]